MRIMVFKGTGNLGDTIQAVALSRLLGAASAIFRDQAEPNPQPSDMTVAAGVVGHRSAFDPSETLFAGIWCPQSKESRDWFGRSPWRIGARDPDTYRWLLSAGVCSRLIGCATLTLTRYEGPRSGEVSVDVPDGPGRRISHDVQKTLTLAEEWTRSLQVLDLYRSAEVVYTTRLHAALPAAAMGTPVVYSGPQNGRTSILEWIGFQHGEKSLPDLSSWCAKYKDFLIEHGLTVLDGDPVMPELPSVLRSA
jgi:hypothetical protein